MNYRIYEHVIGLPSFTDSPVEELEEYCDDLTAEEAEEFIKKLVLPMDKYNRPRRVYVYRLKVQNVQNL